MGLFATKSLERIMAESEAGEFKLKRTLGPGSLVALGIGAIIGAGLFSLSGLAAAQNAGPAVALSMVVASIGCAFAGICYSEFSCMIPVAGSAYTYAYTTLGEWLAWIIGWDLVLEYAVGASTVSISWSGYVVSMLHDFGIDLPTQLIAGPFETLTLPDGRMISGIVNLPAVFIIIMISLLLMLGIKESARTNSVIVVIKLTVVAVFIGIGWRFINPANYTPYIPPNTGEFGHFGLSGIAAGAATIFFAYIGFDAVSTAAQEAKNPQRDMPIGIIGSLAVCTVLYIAFATILTGMVHYTKLGVSAPVAVAIDITPYAWLKLLIKFGIIAGFTSGDAGDAAGPVARVLLDVPRWPGSEGLLRDPPEMAHAVAFESSLHVFCGAVFGLPAAESRRQYDQHRHVICLRDRVRQHPGDAQEEPQRPAPIQDTAGCLFFPSRALFGTSA